MELSGIGHQAKISAGVPSTRADSPEKIKEAAAQFEALLIGQMMKSMRESSSGGWMGESGDSSSMSILELADEQLERVLAARGGLGIARLVVQGLQQPSVKDSSSE